MNKTPNFKFIDSLWEDYFSQSEEKYRRKIEEKIIIASVPLVHNIAKKLARRSTDPIEDIIQVGMVGLIKGVKNFTEIGDTSFKTFVSLYITGEIRHYLRDKVSMIKSPRSVYELLIRINRLTDEINENGFITTESEIAGKLNVPVNRVREVYEVERRKRIISLDGILNCTDNSGVAVKEMIPDDSYGLEISAFDTKILLTDALSKLDDELRQIIKLSFFADETQRAIAEKLGLSQGQVSRRIKKALSILFDLMESEPKMFVSTDEKIKSTETEIKNE